MIVVRTPFRLPLGGGGTDLPAYYTRHGGRLVTAAINKYMYISLNVPALSDEIKIRYSKVEILPAGELAAIQHDIVKAALEHFGYRTPIEIDSNADLGAGTGMGSSGSYAVGLLHGLATLRRQFLPVHELAELACAIEIDRAGKPVGKQDQYAAAFGGVIDLAIANDGTVAVNPIQLDSETIAELENRFLMFYSGLQRDAAEVLGDQGARLRADDPAATAAMHEIKTIGAEILAALVAGDIDAVGTLMHRHWTVKKTVSGKMSNGSIDAAYEAARAAGALGGKIMGAGGGGFLLVVVPHHQRRGVRVTLERRGFRFMPFRLDWEGSKVLVNV